MALVQMLDRKYVEVILQEWLKTISDLPEGFRLAVELMRWMFPHVGLICFRESQWISVDY